MNEILDLVDADDVVIGHIDRNDVDPSKHTIRIVYIGFYTPDGQLILQKRSLTKKNNPGKLTVSVSGHVESGMTYKDAAAKEAFEETGIKISPDDLVEISKEHDNGIMRQTFAYPFTGGVDSLLVEEGEADGFEIIRLDQLVADVAKNPDLYTPYLSSGSFANLAKYIIDTTAIELIEPTVDHKQAVLEYKDEFVTNNEVAHGSNDLDHQESFETWIEKVQNSKNPETIEEGRVPATQLLAIRKSDNRIVGMIQIRHELNEFLLDYGGHIGYSVRKSERRKGYATKMLTLALDYCRSLGIGKVLVTCFKDNIGSAQVIQLNGGVLENEVTYTDGQVMQRHWISLL